MFGKKEKSDGQKKDTHGDCGAERPIVSCAEEALDNVGDHDARRAADKHRSEEIAEREDKGEGSAGNQTRERERKNDAQKRGAGAGAEILGGFDEMARDVFEGSVERKEGERGINVGEGENDGERAIKEKANRLLGDVKVLQEAVEDAVRTQDGFPGVTADEIADPEGNDDELIEKIFANHSVKGHVIGEGVAEKEREHGDAGGDAGSAKKDFGINGIVEELGVILEIPLVDDEAIADEPEAVGKHERVGKKKKKADPQEGREGDHGFIEAGVHGSC